MNLSSVVDNPIRMNLTLFSETASGQETTPAPVQSSPVQPTDTQPLPGEARANSLADYFQQKTAAVIPVATTQPLNLSEQGPATLSTEQSLVSPKLFAGKFKTADDMERSYSELEKWNTQLAQRYGLPPDAGVQRSVIDIARAQAQELETLRAQMTAQEQYAGQGTQDVTQAQPNLLDNLGMTAEEFTDLLYTEPERVLAIFQEQAKTAAVTQIHAWQQEQQTQAAQHQARVENWADQLMHTQASYSDFPQYKDQVIAYIEANQALESLPNAVELAYKAIKADSLTSGPLTIEDVLADDNFLRKIIQSDKVRTEVLRGHVEAIRQNAPPPVISGQTPGLPPASGKEEIKSLKQASEAARSFFDRMAGR